MSVRANNVKAKSVKPRAAPSQRLHATAIALDGKACLLVGPSGCGKSDLALRMLEAGGKLIGDDYVQVSRVGRRVRVASLKPMRGHIEVRGVGIVKLSPTRLARSAPLAAVFALVPAEQIERLPEPAWHRLLDIDVPMWKLAPFEQSAIAKLKLLLGGAAALTTRARP